MCVVPRDPSESASGPGVCLADGKVWIMWPVNRACQVYPVLARKSAGARRPGRGVSSWPPPAAGGVARGRWAETVPPDLPTITNPQEVDYATLVL